MQKLAAVTADFQVVCQMVIESLRVIGYRVESSSMKVEPISEKFIINLLVVVEREWSH